jgi:hypothetical protein
LEDLLASPNSDAEDEARGSLESRLLPESEGRPIPVRISFEIIRLFSEGLYQSPHKAIEELVSNSFDAGALTVHVLTPRPPVDAEGAVDALWVIDDGTGMTDEGFSRLWQVARSEKAEIATGPRGRPPIGQFGIGKLAAYVLAWRITHVSKAEGAYRYTSMNFRTVTGVHQWEEPKQSEVAVTLHTISEQQAKSLLSDIELRSPEAWDMLFGESPAPSWTAAALSDFKDLFGKMRDGMLGWVLRTGLPLNSEFSIVLNGETLVSPKADIAPLAESKIGGLKDSEAAKLNLAVTEDGIIIAGIPGPVSGSARIYLQPLSSGKSSQMGRSHGFFVRVRDRVINLDDELFGLPALNYAAWSRFVMDVSADGLRTHLLSSREGVRTSEPVAVLREYLHAKFNSLRNVFEEKLREELKGIDIQQLLAEPYPSVIIEPLIDAIREDVVNPGSSSYYLEIPRDMDQPATEAWLETFESAARSHPFASVESVETGPYDRMAAYDATHQSVQVNKEHPFIGTLNAHSKSEAPATLVATAEILSDALLRSIGVDALSRQEYFRLRDRVLRILAGDHGPNAASVVRHLDIANQDETAFERAVGEAFNVLGFEYEPRGKNAGGCDGVLTARLGRVDGQSADYVVVYDAKTTDGPAIPADKAKVDSLQDFGRTERAAYAFVIGKAFDGQFKEDSAVNRRLAATKAHGVKACGIITSDLRRLVLLHYQHGVPLSNLRQLFDTCHTIVETNEWINVLERNLAIASAQVPLKRMLLGLEQGKLDPLSSPNVYAVRALDERLRDFPPERLIAALQAVETIVGPSWLSVNRQSGDVKLYHTADQIMIEVNRRFSDELGIPPKASN